MKKSMKTLLSLVLTMILILGTVSSAFAGTVTFKGQAEGFSFGPGSEYTATDLFGDLKAAMPGDVLEDKVTFTNDSSDTDYINLYMKALPITEEDISTTVLTLTEAEEPNRDVALMKDFLHQLTLTVKQDGAQIYKGTPDETESGLTDFVKIGKFYKGATATFKLELEIPADLSNEYANRVGEVIWLFHAEGFNEDQLTVRKVWSDGKDQHAEDSVTVNLLQVATDNKTGEVTTSKYDSVTLDAAGNWAYTWSKLPMESEAQSLGKAEPQFSYEYLVEEEEVPGYTSTIDGPVDGVVTVTNTKVKTPVNPPISTQTSLKVTKEWELAEGQEMPSSVKVVLYRDGDQYRTATLSESNDWTYEFENLSERYSWSVGEADVPEGFTSYVTKGKGGYVITNVSTVKPPLGPGTVSKSVSKAWDDNNNELGLRPSSVSVTLQKDGVAAESVTLSDANGWSHSWADLDATSVWTIVEDAVDNYVALYEENGEALTITNMLDNQVPLTGGPVDLTVKKVWSGDKASNRPAAATVTLYNGDTPVEAVALSAANNWSYTWKELDGAGNWQVLETSIPKGYTPSYQLKDGVLTVTNTASLIQTGQLNWPIAVLGCAGMLLILLGVLMTKRRKAEEQ